MMRLVLLIILLYYLSFPYIIKCLHFCAIGLVFFAILLIIPDIFLGNCLGVLKVKAIVTDDEKQLSI